MAHWLVSYPASFLKMAAWRQPLEESSHWVRDYALVDRHQGVCSSCRRPRLATASLTLRIGIGV